MNIENLYREDLKNVLPLQQIELTQETRDIVIGSLLNVVIAYAIGMQGLTADRIDVMELVAIGNYALVEQYATALEQPNPLGFLLKWARGAMMEYLCRDRFTIPVPPLPGCEPMHMRDIDEFNGDIFDIPEPTPMPIRETDNTPLYEALTLLSPDGQIIMDRLFGLSSDGYCESMAEVSGGDSTTKPYQAVKARKLNYLSKMRAYLQEKHPEYVASHTTQANATIQYRPIRIPNVTLQKLHKALKSLQDRGEAVSMNKLRKESGVNTAYASAYLRSLPS